MTKVVFSLHDQTTELRFPPSLQQQIDLLFGPQASASDRPPNHLILVEETGPDRFSISVDARPFLGEEIGMSGILDVLLEEIVRCLVHDLGSAVALHSASVGWRGHSVLIAGPSGAGKTSLAGWFVARNFEFLSDELVVLLPGGKSTLSFPRPLLAKPGADELVALFASSDRSQIFRTGGNTVISFANAPTSEHRERQAGLIIFPTFVAGSELEFEAISPALTGARLMECNLNARNFSDHGLRALTAFARQVPALTLKYGEFGQLEDVADALARFLLDNAVSIADLQNISSAFRGSRRGIPERQSASRPVQPKTAIPEATPPRPPKKITIGMATYDDYDGVYFSLQAIRLYHPEILDDVEFLVIDNHPDGPCGQALKALENAAPNYRYIPESGLTGTAIRDCVFAEASGDIVVCMDCHVFIVQGALKRLIDYFDAHPGTIDLLQGPLINDDLKTLATHFKSEWHHGMYGTWGTNAAGADPDNPPFEITMQGLGLFACRREAWPGFNPAFRGFGGEEGYIHEKIRQRGGRTLCLPFLRWMHRFNRPMGLPYPNRWEDRIRNYLIGFRELGWKTSFVVSHFETVIDKSAVARIVAELEEEQELDGRVFALSPKSTKLATTSEQRSRDPFAPVWEESALAQQRQLLKRVAAIAEACNVALYLYWGTLLGHVREGGILQWDDDLDLAVFDLSRENYDAFRAAIEADGLQLFDKSQDSDVWIKVCDPTSPLQSYYCPWTWPFIDIFLYSTAGIAAESSWPRQEIPGNLILPGRLTAFEGIRCWEPEQPLALLDRLYADWRHFEKSPEWNHRREAYNPEVSSRPISVDARGRKIPSNYSDKPRTTTEHDNPLSHEAFIPLLRRWMDLCAQHHVRYSIYWGTLLGQIRNERLIPYDLDVDVVVGKSGLDAVYALPGCEPGCVFNDELKNLPPWNNQEIRLVVRRDIVSPNGPRYDHNGEQVSSQVDSCAFNGPLARLIIKLPKRGYGREYWHLDVDMFTDISRFKPYPAVHEVDELPELEDRPLEGLLVSCIKDPLPYIVKYYGSDYMTPDHVYREGRWSAR